MIHFLNDQILNLHGLPERYSLDRLADAVERSLLAAALVSDGPVIVPTVDIVQSPVTKQVLPTLSMLADHGHVDFVGSCTNIDELVSRKQIHFQGTEYHLEWASTDPYEVLTPLMSNLNLRQGDTTYDMLRLWYSDVEEIARNGHRQVVPDQPTFSGRQLTQAQYLMSHNVRRTAYLDAAYRLPDRLGDHAFLWSVVQRIAAFKYKTEGPARKSFERALAYYWIMSHIREYGLPIVGRDDYLGQIDCGLRHQQAKFTFDMSRFRVFLRKIGLERLLRSTAHEVCYYKEEPELLIAVSNILRPWFEKLERADSDKTNLIRDLRRITPITLKIARTERSWDRARPRIVDVLLGAWGALDNSGGDMASPPTRRQSLKEDRQASMSTIFIGHGRSSTWIALRDLIRDRIGLNWEEFDRTPVAGKTVVQRLSEMLTAADFAFLVLTAEDEQVDGKVRARQNVVHELGLFQGRLGFDKAIALIEEGCEEFNNLAGLVQIRFPKGNVMAVSEEIRRVLEDRLSIRHAGEAQ